MGNYLLFFRNFLSFEIRWSFMLQGGDIWTAGKAKREPSPTSV